MSRNRSRKNRSGEPGTPKDSDRSAFFDAGYEWKTDHTATPNQDIEADKNGGGISNRELGRELSEQERVPERGRTKEEEKEEKEEERTEQAADRGEDSPDDRE